jgi:hypothetical protein
LDLISQTSPQTPEIRAALSVLQQNSGGLKAIFGRFLPRIHREVLCREGYLLRIHTGWYIHWFPSAKIGDHEHWRAGLYDFVHLYANQRKGEKWFLSPETSILLRAGIALPSKFVIVASGKHRSFKIVDGTIIEFKGTDNLPAREQCVDLDGLPAYSLEAALAAVRIGFWTTNFDAISANLSALKDFDKLSEILTEPGYKTRAARISGDLAQLGYIAESKKILEFQRNLDPRIKRTRTARPRLESDTPNLHAIKMQELWHTLRPAVLQNWILKPPPRAKVDRALAGLDESFQKDALESLSHDGYKVTVEMVRSLKAREVVALAGELALLATNANAEALSGYLQTFSYVKNSLSRILDGEDAAAVFKADVPLWRKAMLLPAFVRGIVPSTALHDWRDTEFDPTRPAWFDKPLVPATHVRSTMPAFFDLLLNETSPAVRAVLGHFVFAYLSPCAAGSGCLARLMMNLMLAGGNWPWIIIPSERHCDYISAMQSASCGDAQPLTTLLSRLTQEEVMAAHARR